MYYNDTNKDYLRPKKCDILIYTISKFYTAGWEPAAHFQVVPGGQTFPKLRLHGADCSYHYSPTQQEDFLKTIADRDLSSWAKYFKI